MSQAMLAATLQNKIKNLIGILWELPYRTWQTEHPEEFRAIMEEIRDTVRSYRTLLGREGRQQVVHDMTVYFDDEGYYIWPETFKNMDASVDTWRKQRKKLEGEGVQWPASGSESPNS